MYRPQAADLKADDVTLYENIDNCPVQLDVLYFTSEAECWAAIKTLAWVAANSGTLYGACTYPELEGDNWLVRLGTRVDDDF